MLATLFVPPASDLTLESVTVTPTAVLLQLTSTAPTARCPLCQQPASRVHSHYTRTLHDLPAAGRPVQLRVRVRRFFCRTPQCPRWIFSERLPTLAPAFAHRTTCQADALRQLGLVVGGEPGARLGVLLGLLSSPDTLLRLVRQLAWQEPPPTPQQLGVDDWAVRKGRTYGTILIDLDTGRPVDLLPDRTAETLAAWLLLHPGITLVSRDRAGAYAEGIARGAPTARQVADRFHLLLNLGQALEDLLTRVYPQLAQGVPPGAAGAPAQPQPPASAPPVAAPPVPPPAPPRTRPQDRERSAARRERRQQRFAEVHRLAALGWTNAAIARQMDLDRGTVQKWLSCTQFPERQLRPPRRTLLTDYQSYLHRRWQEGCRSARQVWQELRAQGYRGGYSQVAAYVTRLRVGQAVPLHGQHRRRAACPSVRQLKGLLMRPLPALSAVEAAVLAEMGRRSAAVGVAHGLAVDFASLVRDHQPDELSHWVRVAEASAIPELVGFARGIRRDFAAVYAGREGRYSKGPVEGHVNRLKALKRRSYGRANFDLLRLHVLYAH